MSTRALNLAMARPITLCWWIFAVRGGLAIVFAVVLFLTSIFLGIFFFDPVSGGRFRLRTSFASLVVGAG